MDIIGPSTISVDVGGTFTDVTAVLPGGRVLSAKVLSTPDDYSRGIIAGIETACGLGPYPPHLVIHGTTIATNAVLSRKGLGRAAIVTTKGFRDSLSIGRTKRPDLYDMNWDKPIPVVPRDLIFEIDERMDGQGQVLRVPGSAELKTLAAAIRQSGVGVVAVSLINAYANPDNERAIVAMLRDAGCARFVFAATDLSREIQEFERTSTAALNAVLLEPVGLYLEKLGSLLKQRNARGLLIMQSNGGLIPAATAAERPVVLLESGPAAGVLGAAQLARALKLDKVIAFDMGGTTAKGCLIENGRPREAAEYEVGGELSAANRLMKGGGYPVRLPCLELCEVGAGGGSIAWVDDAGVLRVGPHSAGSDPGPACYGRGGTQPTVADAQLVLGYLPGTALGGGSVPVRPDLARDAIKHHIADQLGVSVEDAAIGIFGVANATMGRAIRAVSVERGRDPAEYTLIAFGGSGPIHAAAIARELGIKRVIVPPMAGVFSALAMMAADLRRDSVISMQMPLAGLQSETLLGEFRKVETVLTNDYAAMGVSLDGLEFRRLLDVRYRGQAARVEVEAPADLSADSIQNLFESHHNQLFGHVSDDDVIEIVALRVNATVPGARFDISAAAETSGDRTRSHRAFFESAGWRDAQIVDGRGGLRGDPNGPLVIVEANTTVLVPPGSGATLGPTGSILIDVSSSESTALGVSNLSLEIVRNRFEAIVDEMSAVIPLTARSLVVREGHDFSTAICSPDGELVAQGEGILIHLGSVPFAIEAIRKRFGADIHPGDVFTLNDPYDGGSHLPDFFLIAPIFDDHMRLLGYSVVSTHLSDVGGGVPGGFAAGARDLFQEGMIIPPVRLMQGGKLNDDVWRILTRNTRAPVNVVGDMKAILAASRKADVEFRKLAREMGYEKVQAANRALIEYAETLTRASLSRLPSGTWTATDYLDDDGSGNLIPLTVDLTIENGQARCDFSRSAPQMQNSFNANAGTLTSAVYMAFRCVLDSRIPDNYGFMRCIDVTAKPGTVVSPRNNAATSSRGHTAFRLADVMFKVLAMVVPDKVWAAGEGGLSVVSFSGRWNNAPWMVLDTIGGGTGARPTKDGLEGIAPPITNVQNQPIECQERDYPLRVHEYGYVPDTGGAGRYRGANAMVKEYEVLNDHTVAFTRNDRRRTLPWGLNGGESGAPSTILLKRSGERDWVQLHVFSVQELNVGDRLRMVTAGAGGYGLPKDRDSSAVERDLAQGRITESPKPGARVA